MEELRMNLQLFADAGTLVNATGSYVNAYNGNTTAFDAKNTFNGELKTFYDTELLENARIEMIYAQFAKKQPLPSGNGKTVEWRKWNTFDRATQLQEAVIPTGQKFGMSLKQAGINQYGTYATVSDQLELHAYDDVILGATEEMGASAAETQEVLIRDALYTNTNVLYCDVISAAGAYVSTPTDNAGLVHDATSGYAYMTPDMVAKAVTKLKKDRVPTINGKYVAVIHPSVAYDLRKCEEWIDVHKYAAVTEIFNGEIGELHGCRFIENVFAPVLKGEALSAASVYLTADTTGSDVAAQTDTGHTSVLKVTNTLTSDDQAAIAGRQIMVGGKVLTVYAAKDADELYIQGPNPAIDVSELTDAKVFPGEGSAGGGAAYATYIFGKEAFGIIDPQGGALQMIVHDKSEIGGPLNQFSTIGYKFETNGATMLYPERMLRVMSASAYSDTDVAN
ncbi:MAG: N4-gp56 family major capsid protein [Bacteroidales bacterium]|nr:N4-gp56 family major capsid protein [Bacteroidales bacterium]